MKSESNIKVGLLGASFNTNNMGVSALAESSIKLIISHWPGAEVAIIGGGREPGKQKLFLMGKEITVPVIPLRISKNILLPYHLFWYAIYGLISKVTPRKWFKKHIASRNPYFEVLYESDVAVDITGGDSFSDIYGMGRFFRGFLYKWLMLFLGKKLVLLPQTYGPFNGRLSRIMARYVMKNATAIYSRDLEGIEYTKELLNSSWQNGKIRFAPDVAFVMDARKPDNADVTSIENAKRTDSVLTGLNISGLLFNGGYTQNNMFGLRTDYRELIYSIIDLLMEDKNSLIVLVPHVFMPANSVESDPEACRQIYEETKTRYANRIFMLHGTYNQNEIKYLIGKCDFFLGSRMHSCIAALSQSIPAVGLAYSKKFKGVFGTVGLQENVIDLRSTGKKEILEKVSEVFNHREVVVKKLEEQIPEAQKQLLKVFDDIKL